MNTKNTAIGNTKTIQTNEPNEWIKLAEYGDYQHTRGLQKLTPQSAQTMVRRFHSLTGRLQRKFGGLPVYIGHPDDPEFKGQPGHTDTKAYAWIKNIEARPDGLYILPKWSDAGKELIKNAFYKFMSPRWIMEEVENGAYEPVQLFSVGLTNEPNIPCDAIANTIKAQPKTKTLNERNATYTTMTQKFQTLVNQRMNDTGEDYTTAWANLKHNREDLYNLMHNQ